MNLEYNQKLAAMIVLIVSANKVGRTALNKLLFFADLAYFLIHGRLISGSSYVRQPYGPVPEEIEVTRRTLILAELLKEDRLDDGSGYYQFRYRTQDDKVDLSKAKEVFSEEEIEVINRIVAKLGNSQATVLSDWSHKFEPWKSAESGAPLEFERAMKDSDLVRWMRIHGLVTGKMAVPGLC